MYAGVGVIYSPRTRTYMKIKITNCLEYKKGYNFTMHYKKKSVYIEIRMKYSLF